MTDRINTITVALEKSTRIDDAEQLIAAIAMMRGVASVRGNVSSPEAWAAEMRVRQELTQKLWDVLHPESGG